MGKRVNKKTSIAVDITPYLKEKGIQFDDGAFVELQVKVNHAKDTSVVYGTYIKSVTVDLVKDQPAQPVETA